MQKKNDLQELRQAVEKSLPDKVTPAGEQLAFKLFDNIDNNGNGYASLA
jgi:hypothetical protein